MTHQPSLTKFFQSTETTKKRAGDATLALSNRPKFVDLFCGAGGASCGAEQAGYEVVLAVDCWDVAIECHLQNHPRAQHVLTQLPPAEPLPLPTDCYWHLHGSPPCTKVSQANIPRDAEERARAVDLIKWYVTFAIESSAATWSMEQVSTPAVVQALESLKAPGSKYRNQFEYQTFEFADYGVPQERKRLLAGSPGIVARFARLPKCRRCVKDAIPDPRGTHVRNNVYLGVKVYNPVDARVKRYRRYRLWDSSRPISMPAYTVVAGNFLRWATFDEGIDGEAYRNSYDYTSLEPLTVEESAKLQCFPNDYRFATSKLNGIRLVGNAIPPLVMRQLLPPFELE